MISSEAIIALQDFETNNSQKMINQGISLQKMRKTINEVRKGNNIIEVISAELISRYNSTPFLLTYTLKPSPTINISPHEKLPPEEDQQKEQQFPLDLTTSTGENFMKIIPGHQEVPTIVTSPSASTGNSLKLVVIQEF